MKNYFKSIKYRLSHFVTSTKSYKKIEQNTIGNIVRVETDSPSIALTFDGGPDNVWTPQVLEVLEKHGVPATFFIIGKYAERYREILDEIAVRKHTLGNHSWDHPSFPTLNKTEIRWQVHECSKVLGEHDVNLFRPPYGHINRRTLFDLYKLGKKVITWDVHPFDWQDRSIDWMVESMKDEVRNGSIILLHDAVCDQRNKSRDHMIKALNKFIAQMTNQFNFLTIPELLYTGKPVRTVWHRMPKSEFFKTYERII
jgi:peptidoglycan-N-acetylglucosamine deacetylase